MNSKGILFASTIICLMFSFIGCKTNKLSIYDRTNYTEQELHILTILEIIKMDRPDCEGDCHFKVYCVAEYFDSCVENILSKDHLKAYNRDKKIYLRQRVFKLPNFGTIRFGSLKNADYAFSPFIYSQESLSYLGLCKKGEELRYWVGATLLKDHIFPGPLIRYNSSCRDWSDDYDLKF